MTADQLLWGDDGESLNEGGTWLLDLVAAVDHLNRGHRPRLTVWDAIEEAIRWHTQSDGEPAWDEPDPLRHSLAHLLADSGSQRVTVELQVAIRRWVTSHAERFNDTSHWPHPAPRRGFPPPLLTLDGDEP